MQRGQQACLQESAGAQQPPSLLLQQLRTPRVTLRNVTVTCDPSAPEEPAGGPLVVRLDDPVRASREFWHTWHLVADLRLPAVLHFAVNISLVGVPLPGAPHASLGRDVLMMPAPEVAAAGKAVILDYAYNYETVYVSATSMVRMSATSMLVGCL